MQRGLCLKEAERRAFLLYFRDGLWDLFLGLVLLGLTAAVYLEEVGLGSSSWWMLIGFALAVGVFLAGKWWISLPRMGLVRWGQKRKANLRRGVGILALWLLAGLLLFLLKERGILPQQPQLPLAAVAWLFSCLGAFSMGAYLADLPRLNLYGLIYAVAFPASLFLRDPLHAGQTSFLPAFLGAGCIIVFSLIQLLRFLRAHRLPSTIGETVSCHEA
jgi:hypothetical protein